jgi:hypothetical protein
MVSPERVGRVECERRIDKQKLIQVLRKEKLITEDQLQEAMESQSKIGSA